MPRRDASYTVILPSLPRIETYVRENPNLHTGHFTNATELVLEVNNANCQERKMQLLPVYITLQTPKQGFSESCKKLQIEISPVPKLQDPNF